MIQTTWQLQDAKNKFSSVVNSAIEHGPQIITRRGEKTAVLISWEAYETMLKPTLTVKDWLLSAPPVLGEPLDTKMEGDFMRELDL